MYRPLLILIALCACLMALPATGAAAASPDSNGCGQAASNKTEQSLGLDRSPISDCEQLAGKNKHAVADACPNIDGYQYTVPSNLVVNASGACVPAIPTCEPLATPPYFGPLITFSCFSNSYGSGTLVIGGSNLGGIYEVYLCSTNFCSFANRITRSSGQLQVTNNELIITGLTPGCYQQFQFNGGPYGGGATGINYCV